MSLSQKHIGKVFVPWYNTSEWRKVYDMLRLQNEIKYGEVLDILKMWKNRTPLLSAGIEGTMILLEAVVVEESCTSDIQLSQFYALSLMRFLNICAANNEKQGTFYKTAVKNKLPKWLISMRHDIAHSHKLPSKSLLKLGLYRCLEWVKDKYWDVQKDIICDYVAPDTSINPKIVEILNIYIRLKLDSFFHIKGIEYDDTLIEQINYFISKKYTKRKIDFKTIITILEENLKQSFADPSYKNMAENISNILVTAILNIQPEVTSEGIEHIPTNFRDIWSNLLNILYENGFLFSLLNELLDVSSNIVLDNITRNVASLWIRDIFDGLQKIRIVKEEIDGIVTDNTDQLDPKTSTIILKSVIDKKYPEYKGCLEFNSPLCLSFTEAGVFEKKVLNCPNTYTLIFLESVLKFNKNNENYITDTVSLVKKLIWPSINIPDDDVIYTTDHLKGLLSNGLEMEWSDSEEAVSTAINPESAVNEESTSRWTLVKDTSPFQGCPLGILPQQNRNLNPLISF